MAMKIRNDRQMRALTGLSEEKFKVLLIEFEETYKAHKQRAYEEAVKKGERIRKLGGGRPGKLKTMRDKLEFALRYLKTYPTYDELAEIYDLARSSTHDNVKALVPIVEETLAVLGVLPKREFESVQAFQEYCQQLDLEQLLIDVTERACRRHQDNDKQKEHYSGKKKRHTLQNLIMSTIAKYIVFLGATKPGRHHDYTLLKEAFPPEHPWFELITILVDLGFQGIKSDYVGDDIHLPYKKPRKSKANPNPTLSDEQKAVNRAISKVRILVENAIAGLKRYNILNHPFRNHSDGFDDLVISVSAGLWNFMLS